MLWTLDRVRLEVKRAAKDVVRARVKRRGREIAPYGENLLADLTSSLGRPLRVAVARADGLGDWILTVPLLEALRGSACISSVEIVGPSAFRGLLHRSGYAYSDFDFNTVHLSGTGVKVSARRLLASSRVNQSRAARSGELRRGNFDLVVLPRFEADTGINVRAWAAATGALILGHDPRNLPTTPRSEQAEWQVMDFLVPRRAPSAHEIDHLRALITRMGLAANIRPSWGANFFGVIDPVKSLRVAIHPTAARSHREWPTLRWARLIDELWARYGLSASLLGAPSDAATHDAILASTSSPVRSEIGHVSLKGLPMFLAESTVFVGCDSGLGHLAAAVGIPSVTVSPHPSCGSVEHSNSPVRYRPWSDIAKVVQPDEAVAPCSDFCASSHAHCIRQISVRDVSAAVAEVLAKNDETSSGRC